MRAVVVLAALAVLSAPSPALAGTASIGTDAPWLPYGAARQVLTYTAAAGERNEIVLSAADSASDFVLRDSGATVVAGAGCTRLDEHAVHCRALVPAPPGIYIADLAVVIEAGDGDDSITVPPLWSAPVWARGGNGQDALSGAGTLAGGAGDDVLVGGIDALCPMPCFRRRDTLTGGSGNDVLRGGAGDDVLIGDGEGPQPFAQGVQPDGGAPGDDVLDGGEGRDEAWYAGRLAAVRVDLADPAPDGSAGERDRLVGIEMATGGAGADVLLGSAGSDTLHGDDGADRLDGRGGDDDVIGAWGADVLRGGDGDDRLLVGYVTAAVFGGPGDDTIAGGLNCGRAYTEPCDPGPKSNLTADMEAATDCGSGHDLIRGRVRDFPLLTRCEEVRLAAVRIRPRPQRLPGNRVRFTWRCSDARGCRLTFKLRWGVSYARRTVHASSGDGRRRTFDVRLPRPLPRGATIYVGASGVFRGTWSTKP